MTTADTLRPILASGTFRFADLEVHRLGYGTMQLTGDGVWGEPKDRDECIRVLRRAVELGVDFIDTAAAYGPYVSEELIREALHPTFPARPIGRNACPDMCEVGHGA
jgi:aryl-alcohol dehydrogenase-like predicted oxidoreductase